MSPGLVTDHERLKELPGGANDLLIDYQPRLRFIQTRVVQARHDSANCSFVLDLETARAVSKPVGFLQEIQRKAFISRPDLCGLLLETIGAGGDLFSRRIASPAANRVEISHRFTLRSGGAALL